MAEQERDRNQQLVRAIANPLRVKILKALFEEVSSPKQLSEIIDEPLGKVSYHITVLLGCDCIELVETRPSRGAVEHFYRTKRLADDER